MPGFYNLKLTATNAKGNGTADAMVVYAGNADVVRSTTTWTLAGSPYTLERDVFVDYGVSLNIEPGVVIYGNGHRLQTWGQLNALGTAFSKVIFDHVDILPGFNNYYRDSRMFTIIVQFSDIIGGSIHPATGYAVYGNLQLRDSLLEDESARRLVH